MASRQEVITAILDQLIANAGSDIGGAVAVAMDGIVVS